MPDNIMELVKPLIPMATAFLLRVIGVLIALWIAFKLARWLGTNITTKLENRDFDKALSRFFGSLARYAVIVGAVLACLGVFGVNTTSFAAVIGAAGLAVGLAFQGTLSNFAAGIMLLVFRPFKVGDVVKAAGNVGGITEIGLFTTSFDTPDNRRIIIPNSAVAGGTIENVTFHGKRRVDIDVGVDYGTNVGETRDALEKAIASVEKRLEDGDHMAFLAGLGDSAVNWQVRVWCKTEDYWDVWQATITAVKSELETAKIGIPYPNMEVHLLNPPAA